MSDEQELPPGFLLTTPGNVDVCVRVHDAFLDDWFHNREAAIAEAWRIYRAIELDVLRQLWARDPRGAFERLRSVWETPIDELDEVVAEERRIYRAIELDVLRGLQTRADEETRGARFERYAECLAESLDTRIADLERAER